MDPILAALMVSACAQPPPNFESFTPADQRVVVERCREVADAAWLDRLRHRRIPLEVGLGFMGAIRRTAPYHGPTVKLGFGGNGVHLALEGSVAVGQFGWAATATGALGVPVALGEWLVRPGVWGALTHEWSYFGTNGRTPAAGLRLELVTPSRIFGVNLDGGLAHELEGNAPTSFAPHLSATLTLVWYVF